MSVLAVDAPPGGWAHPWPAAVELARVLSVDRWVLVGGLMVQLHAAAQSFPAVRPTDDLDVLLNVRAHAGALGDAVSALRGLGYEPAPPLATRDLPTGSDVARRSSTWPWAEVRNRGAGLTAATSSMWWCLITYRLRSDLGCSAAR